MTTSPSSKHALRGIRSLINVTRSPSTPLYQQIYLAFRSKITQGELRAGDIVPSTRELARQLGISRIPVLNAYAQLIAEAHLESRTGSGTFVSSAILTQSPGTDSLRTGKSPSKRSISSQAAAVPRFERPVWAENLGPFQVGQPELKNFPIQIWSRLLSRYSRELRVRALQYGDPLGLEELRHALATYLRTSRGVRCDPGQIMVVSGSQQALDISTRVLLDPGATAWVEEPGYWLVHHVLAACGCRAVPVPVDMDGLNVSRGIKMARNARAAYVAPAHQYPLGVTMGAARRFQLLEWANKTASWIIEDDYDSEFRYDSMPIASLQGLDNAGRVIYTGTFSKVMFPSLRLGYIVVPKDLVDRFAAVRQAMDICPTHASQAVLAMFIREGHFARHIRKMRRLYEERRGLLVEAIKSEFGDSCELVGAEAGLHITLFLDERLRDVKIAAQAAQRKLWLSALSPSYAGSDPRQGFVLGFGNAPSARISRAVRLLRELVKSC